jgi:phosphatidylglycerol---prolipoprotein diacylglyceryl transferase
MCRTLFHIPPEIAGYQVFGLGLLLALWAVASIITLAVLVRRQGFNADTLGYVPILLVIGAIIVWVLPAIRDESPDGTPLGLPIRGYGLMMLLAVVSGTLLAAWRAKRVGIDPDLLFMLIFWMLIPGIIGARAFHVIEYWRLDYWPKYAAPGGSLAALLGEIVNVAQGGLVVYGSFFGGVLGILLFVRKYRMPLLALCDLIAPAMLLGLAIGRVGCVLNGCCFGAVCDHPWAIHFPAGVQPPFNSSQDAALGPSELTRRQRTILAHLSPPYLAQVDRGQFYGFTLGADPEQKPCVVLRVAADSSAARAGLQAGDRLEAINGLKISTVGDAYLATDKAFLEGRPLKIDVADRPAISIAAAPPPTHSLAVEPSQPLSTIDALVLCLLLLAYDPFRRRDGELFALMMSIYPVTRFLIEFLRSDEAGAFGTRLSIGQCVSLPLLVCAAALWFYILRQPKGTAFHHNRQTGSVGR